MENWPGAISYAAGEYKTKYLVPRGCMRRVCLIFVRWHSAPYPSSKTLVSSQYILGVDILLQSLVHWGSAIQSSDNSS